MSSRRTFGLASHHEVRAADVLQANRHTSGKQPLPAGQGGRVKAKDLGITEGVPLRLLVIGDSGGVKAPAPQNAVSYAMQTVHHESPHTAVLHVGDVVYFNGDPDQYAPQFYEPYAHLNLPIVAIPGNHDGDVAVDDAGNATGRQPLDTFLENFCASSPGAPLGDPQLEYGRHTQTLPWCDWTAVFDAVTIVGLYSNVPSGGSLEQSQLDWYAGELTAAAPDRPLITLIHHPPYSVDAHHGGSGHIGAALDGCFEQAKRCPDVVISGHVHDYQRFTRTYWDRQIPYVVIGNSGYHNLHQLAADAKPGEQVGSDVVFEFGDAKSYGFLGLEIADGTIKGVYCTVSPGSMPDGSDAVSGVGADAWTVRNGQVSVA